MPIPQSFDLPYGCTGDRTWVHPKGAAYQAQDTAVFQDRLRDYELQLAQYNQMYGRGNYSRPPMNQQYGYNNGFSSGGYFGRGGMGGGGLNKGLMGFLGGSLIGGGIGRAIGSHQPSNSYNDPSQGSGGSFFDNNQGMVGGSTDYLGGGGGSSFFDNDQGGNTSDYLGGVGGGSSFFDQVGNDPSGGFGGGSFFDQGGSTNDF
ncbi:hypothetical protein DFQ27_008502 [Actinomortierella ambigua]|uniref:Uncharacterized protein n=1 Tax=Actinomortierella ambigua TaxID=1343610 RepID=A0A9P6TXU0_9FUNG|nr:hypothetical protein DFQ27_008502 [Actinomortierella ambigua]